MNKYIMPAEYNKHYGTIIVWPTRAGSWGKDPSLAQHAFTNIINELAKVEKVFLICNSKDKDTLLNKFTNNNINILDIDTDDAWARDIGPTFISNTNSIKGIDWNFNAWGGDYNGLYKDYDNDNILASKFLSSLKIEKINKQDFVLEGGAIHSDGEGTIMVTETCLLSKGRNPQLTKLQIEEVLLDTLNAQKVLWLPCGIYNDETDEHIDNICAFINPAEVVLATTDNKEDPQYEMSNKCIEYLQSVTDAKGRRITIHKLPIPDNPIILTNDNCNDYTFEEGEAIREENERLAASYVNFYFANDIILLPVFKNGNELSDERAIKIIEELCPNHKVIPIYARDILMGGGNIHCITQQIPNCKEFNYES